jgi:hypothetical protein
MAADVDIDFANRAKLIDVIKCTPAMHIVQGKIKTHNSGVYVQDIPVDPLNNCSAIDFKVAEDRGYFKIDLLNMSVYEQVKDEAHLLELMKEPDWNLLKNKEFVEKLVHISAHFDTMLKMPEPVNSVERMAMFLSVIRPAKRYLIGRSWKDVAKEVWTKPADGGYYFKKSHSLSYSLLVVVHMNLIANTFN